MTIPIEDGVDFALIREVFLDCEYEHEPLNNPTHIFDVGANVGMASLYFHYLYPHATIHAFEADAAIYPRLIERTRHIPQIITYNMALTDRDGTIPFYSHSSSLAGSLVARDHGRATSVECHTISSIMRTLRISALDLLKFDIEGGEYALFSEPENWTGVRYLIGEVHLDILDMSLETFSGPFRGFETRITRQIGPRRFIFEARAHL